MQTSSTELKIVDGTELTTTSNSNYYIDTSGRHQTLNSGGGAVVNQASDQLQLGQSCISYYPWYQTTAYVAPPVRDVVIRFVENGCLVSFRGKEYIFKDIVAAANHIVKIKEQK